MNLHSIDPASITLGMQIAELQRELRMREEVYPKQIGSGKMKLLRAQTQMASLKAAINTLEEIQRAKREIAAQRARERESIP